jgi:acetyl-CoA C-acetyltransferase
MTNFPVIVSFARTPIAKFCGSFQSLSASKLGSIAIMGALSKLPEDVQVHETYMGNVLTAGQGQAPCRQAVIGAGLSNKTICTTINKVCASGMKSVMISADAILAAHGNNDKVYLAGGFESMTNTPHYLFHRGNKKKLGHMSLVDATIHDGLWDAYNDQHMGMCAEKCSKDYNISREEQDAYAITSYLRAQKAMEDGKFSQDIVPVTLEQQQQQITIEKDEEPFSVDFTKISKLSPAFMSDGGTVTAGNSSSLNDGAAAMIIMSYQTAKKFGIPPLARILGYGDAAQLPQDFTTTPTLAVKEALLSCSGNTKFQIQDIEYHEINEAFAVVALANMHLMNLDVSRVNV